MKKALENGTLNLPKPKSLSADSSDIPYVCVGDDAFPLTTYMMKPYHQKDLSPDKRIFNYRLSRARRISENAFGILANRWRVFRKPFALQPEKVKIVTFSVLILHNWLRSESKSGKIYVPSNLIDFEDTGNDTIIPGEWRNDIPTGSWLDLPQSNSRSYTKLAKEIRDDFKILFMKEGSIPWQWKPAQVNV